MCTDVVVDDTTTHIMIPDQYCDTNNYVNSSIKSRFCRLINSVVAVVMLNSGFVGCQYIDSIMIHSMDIMIHRQTIVGIAQSYTNVQRVLLTQ